MRTYPAKDRPNPGRGVAYPTGGFENHQSREADLAPVDVTVGEVFRGRQAPDLDVIAT
jgi:hypothetical protein